MAKRVDEQISILCDREVIPYTSDRESLKLRKEAWLKKFQSWVSDAVSQAPTGYFRGNQRTAINSHAGPPRAIGFLARQQSQAIVRAQQPTFARTIQGSNNSPRLQIADATTRLDLDKPRFLCELSENQRELQNMASICAYLGISVSRLIDNVTMYIRDEFVSTLGSEIESALKRKLKDMDRKDFMRYAADNHVDVRNRDLLSKTKSVLMREMDNLRWIADPKWPMPL